MRPFLHKTFAGFCTMLLVVPMLYLAFFYEGLYETAYAQTSGLTNAPNPSAGSSFGLQVGSPRSPGDGGSTIAGGGAALEGAVGAAKCGVQIVLSGAGLALAAIALPKGIFTQDVVTNVLQAGTVVKESFLDCLARAIAKAILRSITRSIVAWAQSGFNGNPSFVEDFRGFMLGIADETVGEFILGTPLSFLCSPFQLKVRIALAKRFAAREAPLCTLSQITRNIEGFTSDFTQGGWPAFLEFTVGANNNPYGGFILAEAQLTGAVASAQGQKQFDLSLGSGFLSFTEKTNCRTIDVPDTEEAVEQCDEKTVTPGRVVEGSLDKALGTNFAQLESAKYFDEIIDALITGLMVRVLYGGLSNEGRSSSSGGGTVLIYDDTLNTGPSEEVRGLARDIIVQLDLTTQTEGRIRNAKVQSLSSIEGAQGNLESLALCWESKEGRHPDAKNNAANARLAARALEPRTLPLESDVAVRERRLSDLDYLRSQALNARSVTDIQNLASSYLTVQTATSAAPTLTPQEAEAEFTQVQAEMDVLNQSTAEKRNQCNAL